uniref:Uncharacterized protein n=1 Tax=Kalanchoe fedtschenkoi TaxID=63787 RepID=A0A7N0TM38_KALFE
MIKLITKSEDPSLPLIVTQLEEIGRDEDNLCFSNSESGKDTFPVLPAQARRFISHSARRQPLPIKVMTLSSMAISD